MKKQKKYSVVMIVLAVFVLGGIVVPKYIAKKMFSIVNAGFHEQLDVDKIEANFLGHIEMHHVCWDDKDSKKKCVELVKVKVLPEYLLKGFLGVKIHVKLFQGNVNVVLLRKINKGKKEKISIFGKMNNVKWQDIIDPVLFKFKKTFPITVKGVFSGSFRMLFNENLFLDSFDTELFFSELGINVSKANKNFCDQLMLLKLEDGGRQGMLALSYKNDIWSVNRVYVPFKDAGLSVGGTVDLVNDYADIKGFVLLKEPVFKSCHGLKLFLDDQQESLVCPVQITGKPKEGLSFSLCDIKWQIPVLTQ